MGSLEIAVVVDAGLGDDEDPPNADRAAANAQRSDRPGCGRRLGDGEVRLSIDVDAPLGRDGQTDRLAGRDESAGPPQLVRVDDVEGAGQELHGVVDVDGLDPLVAVGGRPDVPAGRVGRRDADATLAARLVEPLDGSPEIRRVGQRRGRLDQDEGPEPPTGGLEPVERVKGDVDRRGVVGRELRRPARTAPRRPTPGPRPRSPRRRCCRRPGADRRPARRRPAGPSGPRGRRAGSRRRAAGSCRARAGCRLEPARGTAPRRSRQPREELGGDPAARVARLEVVVEERSSGVVGRSPAAGASSAASMSAPLRTGTATPAGT